LNKKDLRRKEVKELLPATVLENDTYWNSEKGLLLAPQATQKKQPITWKP